SFILYLHLKSQNGARLPQIFDAQSIGALLKFRQKGLVPGHDAFDIFHCFLSLEKVKTGQRGATANRICGKGMTVKKRFSIIVINKRLVDAGGAGRYTKCNLTTGMSFAQTDDIRFYFAV